MRRPTIVAVVTLFAVCVPAVFLAGQPAEEAPAAAQTERPQRQSEPQPLGKTVRLTFTVHTDDGDRSFPVVCAAKDFLIEHDITEADGGHQLKITGEARSTDNPQQLLVSFEAMHYHANDKEGHTATFNLKGSAGVTFDKKIELGRLGDEMLSLTITIVD